MGKFTALNKSQIKEIISEYSQLSQENYKTQAVSAGTVNTYYRISYPSKKNYFLKIDEVGNLKRLQNEISIFIFLKTHKKKLNFDFPSLLKTTSGKFYVKYAKKYILILTEVAGKPTLTNLKPPQLKLVGMSMAKLHRLSSAKKMKSHRFDLMGLQKVFLKIKSALQRKRPELASFISKKFDTLRQNAPKKFKPVLIHADLFPDNIHWVGKKLHGIIDYEAAGLGHPLFDICVAIHALCHDGKNFESKKIRSLFCGYESVQKIDKKYFSYFMQLAALRFLITRLKDFDLPGLNPKMKDFRNYKDYLRRFEQIDDHMLSYL